MRAEAVGNHLGGDVAGMRARNLGVAILCADFQRAVGGQCRCHIEKRHRRADQGRDVACQRVYTGRHRLDLVQRRPRTVHFPVAGNQRADIRRHLENLSSSTSGRTCQSGEAGRMQCFQRPSVLE